MSARIEMGINAGRYNDEELIKLSTDHYVLNSFDRDDLYDLLEELSTRYADAVDNWRG